MIHTLKKFFAFCGEDNRKMFVASIWLGVISAICSAMRVPAVYVVLKALLTDSVTKQTLGTALAILVVSLAISIAINMKSTMLQTRGGYRCCANKRIEIAEHLRYLPMGWFSEGGLGEIASVTTNTMETMSNIATRVVMITTKGYLTVGIILIMMCLYDWRIGLTGLAGMVIFLLVNALAQKAARGVSKRKVDADQHMVAKVLEYVQGIAEVKNYNLIADETTRVEQAVEECYRASFALEIPAFSFMFLQFVINKFTGVAICICAVLFLSNGSLPLADALMMLICSFMLFEQLDGVGSFSMMFRTINICMDKVNAIMKTKPMDIDGKEIDPPSHALTLEHVDFSYDQKQILSDISMTIPEKSTVAIVGPSGSGKTTLCSLMARFWDVQSGSVKLGGIDVRDYSYDSLIRNFSYVFQRTYLFSDTIANNIRFGRPEASMEEVIAAAKKACCHDFIMSLPEGYDTLIGEGGATISGGERQRLTIARAIMKDAPIIILDEATANVDPENEKDLVEAIHALTLDKTVILIAHRLKTVRSADCIYVLDGGRLVQQGTHEDLIQTDGIYRHFVVERRQAAGWKVG